MAALHTDVRWGWIAIAMATIARMASGPGQTFSISILANAAASELDIGPDVLSVVYGTATIVSGLSMGLVGGLVDRLGARVMAILACVGLALGCVLASVANSPTVLWFAFLICRMAGQGTLSIVGASIVARWFEARRGFATSVAGGGMVAAAMILPLADAGLVAVVGWRGAWLALAIMVLFVFLPLLAMFTRSTPQSIGVKQDFGATDGSIPVHGNPDSGAAGTIVDAEAQDQTSAAAAAAEADRVRKEEVTGLLTDDSQPASVETASLQAPAQAATSGGLLAVQSSELAGEGDASDWMDEDVSATVVSLPTDARITVAATSPASPSSPSSSTPVAAAAASPGVQEPASALAFNGSMTVRQAAGTSAFWALLFVDFERAAVNTAITFFLGAILADLGAVNSDAWKPTANTTQSSTSGGGMDPTALAAVLATGAATVLSTQAGVAVPATILTGWAADRLGANRLLAVTFILQAIFLTVLAFSSSMLAAAAAGVIWGFSVGCEQVLLPVIWPALFGTDHIGALRGVDFQALVIGSAVGPIIFGFLHSQGLPLSNLVLGCVPVALLAASISLLASRGVETIASRSGPELTRPEIAPTDPGDSATGSAEAVRVAAAAALHVDRGALSSRSTSSGAEGALIDLLDETPDFPESKQHDGGDVEPRQEADDDDDDTIGSEHTVDDDDDDGIG